MFGCVCDCGGGGGCIEYYLMIHATVANITLLQYDIQSLSKLDGMTAVTESLQHRLNELQVTFERPLCV